MKRGKIVRLLQARMLGIAKSPDKPTHMRYEVENCHTVSLQWDESKASGFPVHSYRIQRKAIGSVGIPLTNHSNSCQRTPKTQMKYSKSSTSVITQDHSTMLSRNNKPSDVNNDEDNYEKSNDLFVLPEGVTSETRIRLEPMDETCSRQKELTADALQWQTIYIGADNEFLDTDLEPGAGFLYRVQAWNSHGKSEWTREDMTKEWKKKKCTNSRGNTTPPRPRFITSFGAAMKSFWDLINTCGNIFMTLLVVAGSVARFRRGQLTSTASYLEPVFPWLWVGINWISRSLIGLEVIPKSLTEDESFRQESSTFHDQMMKLVGLQGYETSPHRPKRKIIRATSSSYGDQIDHNVTKNVDLTGTGKKRVGFRRVTTSSSKSLQSFDSKVEQHEDPLNDLVITSKDEKSKMKRRRGLFKRKHSASNKHIILESEGATLDDSKENHPHHLAVGSQRSLQSCISSLSGGEIDTGRSYDELEYCNKCLKRYKFPKRCRHHCARCSATFCHKHGRTTHSNFVPCKVPGDCVCNVCLEAQQAQNADN